MVDFVTRVLLIRHASADHVGRRLAGRAAGLHLDGRGRAEAGALAAWLAELPLAAVYSSPQERARETAAPIAAVHGLEAVVLDAFQEIDFGEWTGRAIDELDGPAWRAWNGYRSTSRPPGGESMTEVLGRALASLGVLGERHGDATIAVVSHCDVIRPLLAHFLGMPLDHLLRLEVDPASVSTVELNAWGPRILGVNRTAGAFDGAAAARAIGPEGA